MIFMRILLKTTEKLSFCEIRLGFTSKTKLIYSTDKIQVWKSNWKSSNLEFEVEFNTFEFKSLLYEYKENNLKTSSNFNLPIFFLLLF